LYIVRNRWMYGSLYDGGGDELLGVGVGLLLGDGDELGLVVGELDGLGVADADGDAVAPDGSVPQTNTPLTYTVTFVQSWKVVFVPYE
jgi:hypothetical protein